MHLPRVSFRHRRQMWARHRVVEQMKKHCALYPEWGEEVAKGLPVRLPLVQPVLFGQSWVSPPGGNHGRS
jgi:hypothetical protein